MKKNNLAVYLPKFTEKFSQRDTISKRELREFYLQYNPEMVEPDFRRFLFALEKNQHVVASGRGVYQVRSGDENQPSEKKKFTPHISPLVDRLSKDVREGFPFLDFQIWETEILNEFMLHQPGVNLILLDVEKDAGEAVFNFLVNGYPGQPFLDPDRIMLERYVFQKQNPILISKLVSQTPMGNKGKGIPYARLEKILVDILVDSDRFFLFQGQELVTIYENVFSHFFIDEKSMVRYAGRRNAISRLSDFISRNTRIEFKQIGR